MQKYQISGQVFNLMAFLVVIFLVISSVQCTGHATSSVKPVVVQPAVVVEGDKTKEDWGIEVTSVRLTAHNYMVDFRYRVLDIQKADTLFSKHDKPYLVHHASGKVLSVPRTAKVGPLMSTYHHQQDRIYWMFFSNRMGVVKPGDTVSVVIGNFQVDNITLQ